jgi:hypothetical protein
MNFRPRDRLTALYGFLQPLDLNGLLGEHRMAVHAHVERRDAGMAARSCAAVAIQTRNARVAGVKRVGKGNRLSGRVALVNAHP